MDYYKCYIYGEELFFDICINNVYTYTRTNTLSQGCFRMRVRLCTINTGVAKSILINFVWWKWDKLNWIKLIVISRMVQRTYFELINCMRLSNWEYISAWARPTCSETKRVQSKPLVWTSGYQAVCGLKSRSVMVRLLKDDAFWTKHFNKNIPVIDFGEHTFP